MAQPGVVGKEEAAPTRTAKLNLEGLTRAGKYVPISQVILPWI